MKKTTRKELENTSTIIIKVKAGELYNLLLLKSPDAYNSGVYGWNYDAYYLENGVTLVRGDRNMPGVWAKNAAEYERKAKKIMDACNKFEKKQMQIETLIEDFCLFQSEGGGLNALFKK